MRTRIAIITLLVTLWSCSDETAAGKNSAANSANSANNSVNATPNSQSGEVVITQDEQAVCGVECAGGEPLCEANRRICVECSADSDCGADEAFCDGTGECQECLADSQCGDGQVCDPAENGCVGACETDADCEPEEGQDRFCDADSGRCLHCVEDADCTGERGICGSNGLCTECLADGDCGAEDPFCDVAEGRCRECRTDADCDGSACVDFECAECASDSDCPESAPICDPQERECIVCGGDADCGGDTPLCDEGEGCVECLEDEDCEAGFVCGDSVCEPE